MPKRKAEEHRRLLKKTDNFLTPAKIQQLKNNLADLKRQLPAAAEEVQRTAEMGDLSENAAYQIAKSNLRSMNNRILSITERIKDAIPIEAGTGADDKIRLGSIVILSQDDKTFTYQIIGAQEVDPARGKISHSSPLGTALLGHRKGDEIIINAKEKSRYRIEAVK